MDLVSHTTYVLCVNFIHNLQVDRFFDKLFMAILFAHRVFDRNLMGKKYFFHILVLMSDLRLEPLRRLQQTNIA